MDHHVHHAAQNKPCSWTCLCRVTSRPVTWQRGDPLTGIAPAPVWTPSRSACSEGAGGRG